jgi:Ser/Thr protein kinase RdoA (MazF antagonist)
MSDETIMRAYAAYGVVPQRLLPVQKGYRNESHAAVLGNGRRANLIIYKNELGIAARIRRANAVADLLTGQLPVRRTLDPRVLRLSSGQGERYASLYTYLDGDTIPWEAYTQTHLKNLGQAMGLMHQALHPSVIPLPKVTDEYRVLLQRMETYFADPQVARALQEKLGLHLRVDFARLHKLLDTCGRLKRQQPLHMDFVRSNILFGPDAAVTGIIDFERTGQGHPVLDVARTLAFLLVDCKYKPADKVRKYFLQSGYYKRGGGPLLNAGLLDGLLTLNLLHDFYKFLRHNPYEFLTENEHYLRTADLLRTHRLVT